MIASPLIIRGQPLKNICMEYNGLFGNLFGHIYLERRQEICRDYIRRGKIKISIRKGGTTVLYDYLYTLVFGWET